MAIDIGRLEGQLLHMSEEGAPGREFCEAISELARTGRFAQLHDALPGIVYDELWTRHKEDPAGFVGWMAVAGPVDAPGLYPACATTAYLSHATAAGWRKRLHACVAGDSACT